MCDIYNLFIASHNPLSVRPCDNINIGKHLWTVWFVHIKRKPIISVPHWRETSSTTVSFTSGCFAREDASQPHANKKQHVPSSSMRLQNKTLSLWDFLLFSVHDKWAVCNANAALLFSHVLCIVGRSEVEKSRGAAVLRDQGTEAFWAKTTHFASPKLGGSPKRT